MRLLRGKGGGTPEHPARMEEGDSRSGQDSVDVASDDSHDEEHEGKTDDSISEDDSDSGED